jgi:GNAT superfamily N-acetyltransferase
MSSQTVEDPAPATEADLEHTIEEIRCYQVSFKHNGAEIGRAQLHASASHILEVVDLFVKPEYRGRGYSHRILSQLTGLAHELGASQVSGVQGLPADRVRPPSQRSAPRNTHFCETNSAH